MAGVTNIVFLLIFLQCFACISCEESGEMWWTQQFVFTIPVVEISNPPRIYITTSSTRNLRTTLDYPSTGYRVSYNVSRSSPAIIELDGGTVGTSDIRIGPHEGPQNKTIIIRSEGTVSVHAIDNKFGYGDGFVVYSNSQLGTEYYVTSYYTWTASTSFVCVSSIQPNTLVNIKTKAGKTRSITLRENESFRFDGEKGEDLSGTLVRSDKPTAVISGTLAISSSLTASADGILEQVTPTNQWKSIFILTPFLSLNSGFIYRIYSTNVETTISTSDNITLQLQPESFYERNVVEDKIVTISADHPVMVVQYMGGYTTYDPRRGDLSMVVIPPVTSLTPGVVTFPVIEYIVHHVHEYFINVVTDCDNVGGLFLDNKIDIRHWDRLTTEDQYTCCVRGNVTSGQHTVSHTDLTASYYILVYGIGVASSYAYTASTYYVEDDASVTSQTTVMPIPTTGIVVTTKNTTSKDVANDIVRVKQVKPTEIVISWESFQADENIDHFRVFYNTGDTLNLNMAHIVEVNGAMSMTILSDLAATTLYTVRVEAYTKTGQVYAVGEIKVTTTSEILQVEGQKATEVHIRWDGFKTAEDIVGFRVLYTSDDFSNIKSVSTYHVENVQQHAVISGLEPATLYIIRVEAFTNSNTILVGEVTVTTETAAADTVNTPLVIGSAVGGIVLVIIIIIIAVVCTRHHRQSNSPDADPQYEMRIHRSNDRENTSGDINEGYEVPRPEFQSDHNVEEQPYMVLDGTQRIDPHEY